MVLVQRVPELKLTRTVHLHKVCVYPTDHISSNGWTFCIFASCVLLYLVGSRCCSRTQAGGVKLLCTHLFLMILVTYAYVVCHCMCLHCGIVLSTIYTHTHIYIHV